MRYRKKPVEIEAVRWTGTAISLGELEATFKTHFKLNAWQEIEIETLEGTMKASVGDYIIKGVNGEFYPCKPDIFRKTYEVVE